MCSFIVPIFITNKGESLIAMQKNASNYDTSLCFVSAPAPPPAAANVYFVLHHAPLWLIQNNKLQSGRKTSVELSAIPKHIV